jgi:hypothetical protein
MFPAAPEKPVISDVTDSSIRLSWQLLLTTGASIISYQVEYFAYGQFEVNILCLLPGAMSVSVKGVLKQWYVDYTYILNI